MLPNERILANDWQFDSSLITSETVEYYANNGITLLPKQWAKDLVEQRLACVTYRNAIVKVDQNGYVKED